MNFKEKKQITFRLTDENADFFNNVFNENKKKLPENINVKDFILFAMQNKENIENIDNDYQLKTMLAEKENRIAELENKLENIINENSENIDNDNNLKTILAEKENIIKELENKLENNNENYENTNNDYKLFSYDNQLKLWSILQIFKRDTENIKTFEAMIMYIIANYQKAGFLKLEKNDINYLESIKETYNGQLI